jgi:hypothetical protein
MDVWGAQMTLMNHENGRPQRDQNIQPFFL